METRKNPSLDLRRKRGLFFNLGLVLALLLIVSAFEWRSPMAEPTCCFTTDGTGFDPPPIIPPTVIPPPKRPPAQQPEVIVAREDEIIEEIDFTFDPDEIDIAEDFFEPDPEPAPEPTKFIPIEEMPNPVDGYSSFYKFISRNIKYPPQARRLEIEGKVFLQFVVDESGNVTEATVLKGIGGGCDEEALRVLNKAPKWNPGKQRGVPTKVRMIIPITFRLN